MSVDPFYLNIYKCGFYVYIIYKQAYIYTDKNKREREGRGREGTHTERGHVMSCMPFIHTLPSL